MFRWVPQLQNSKLLVECRTPSQWMRSAYPPSEQDLFGASRTAHTSLANHTLASDRLVLSCVLLQTQHHVLAVCLYKIVSAAVMSTVSGQQL
jgi:hypothetical protein